ncbi:PREDICTED: neuroligin-4, X-linked-like [Eufriesea mexicana]|uniref:neuroligin-4, X-linked-like n=1 Tax=Eufriesea mexicana TaxID=516756 RepID=UPI00083C1605|nr:PREDICTED: neuroligin-4, X-linked-like [Eufriesea mexicana]
MEFFLILVCLIAPPTLSLSIKSKLNPRIVQTRYGEVQGVVRSFEKPNFLKPIDVYLGIPYATPPIGSNRFSPTKAASPWEGVRLSDTLSPVCPQKLPDISNEQEALERMPKGRLENLKRLLPYLRNQSEDCLYLNIYAPTMGMGDSGRKHPVLLYIHGESYDWGSGNPYDGSVLASYNDQVVVTMNYRLGVLGFLNARPISPQTKARVANYGLMDQIAALKWVQDHIALFGGNPKNVTLMGQGTGAACVHFLAISPTVSRDLFTRAILLSGSALSSWAVVEDPVSYALKIAKAVNCTIPEDLVNNNERIVDCLRDRSLEELMQVDIQPPTFLSAFGPSVDDVVIKPDFQKDLLSYMGPEFQGFGPLPKRAEHGAPITSNNKYDLLFGVTTSEALWKFSERDVQLGFEGERRDRIIRTYVRNAYVYHLTEIFYTVVNEYTDWERTVQHPVNTKDACVQALSDAEIVAPLVQTGDLFTLRHTKKSNNPHIAPIPESEKEPMPKTYFYVFDYQMKYGDYPQKMGSVHGEELPFVFGAPLVGGFGHFLRNYSKFEEALSESVSEQFANFCKIANPNVIDHHGRNDTFLPISGEKNRFRSLTWEQYDPVHQKYLEIGPKPKLRYHYRAHQLSVWLRLVPELHRAGMEDVDSKHNLFRGHSDPSLYDGSVRPDPLSRISEEFKRKNTTTEPPTTTDYNAATCVSYIQNTNFQNVHNTSTDPLASLDAAGYAAYSTALSVTIAIGCSLLILNVLIFAGVYYQRDKTRLEVKSLQQQQLLNQQCGPRGFSELKQPPPPHSHFPGSGQVIVDVENAEMLRRNVMKGPPNDPNTLLQQGQGTHTLPHQHHYQKQHQQQHATLPRASVIQDMNAQTQGPPNGSIHLTVPRAPPPPRAKSPPENQPLLQNATVSSRVSQATMSEMRV